jgi:uncharacterized membrane protein YhaH (DUF805 family)
MPDNASTSSPPAPPTRSAFLGYRGRMGRLGYWIGISIAGVLLFGAVFALVRASTPTAMGDATPLALLLLTLFFWVHSLVTVKRLRDSGLPAWQYVFYVFVPIAWLALVGAQGDSSNKSDAVFLAGFVAILALPGFTRASPTPLRKPRPTDAARDEAATFPHPRGRPGKRQAGTRYW